MSKIEIILVFTSLIGLGMTLYLYKKQNKSGQVIKYIEINNQELK